MNKITENVLFNKNMSEKTDEYILERNVEGGYFCGYSQKYPGCIIISYEMDDAKRFDLETAKKEACHLNGNGHNFSMRQISGQNIGILLIKIPCSCTLCGYTTCQYYGSNLSATERSKVCSIHPLPGKKNVNVRGLRFNLSGSRCENLEDEYAKGWNDCLEYLIGR